MEIDHHRIDIIRSPAVMVHHADLGNGVQKGLALHLVRPVGIHHHQQALGVSLEQSVLTGNEGVGIFRHSIQPLQQLTGCISLHIQNNLGLLPLFPAQAANAHRRTQGVQVCIFMAHHKYLAALSDELGQGIGRNPGADLGAVVRFLGAAAVEGEIIPVLDDRLIPAPGQGHLNAERSKIIALFKADAVPSNSQGDGSGNPGGTDHLANFLQEVELVLNGHLQIPDLKHKEEPVSLQPPEQAVVSLCAAGNHLVELRI